MTYPSAVKANAVAVITGAGYGGIGYALASTFAFQKMKLALIDNSSEHLSKAVTELQRQGANKDDITSITADVGNWDEIHKAAKTVFDKFGKVNVLCLNAGTSGAGAKCWDSDKAIWDKVLGCNLLGVIYGSQAFVGGMVKGGEEGIVLCTGSKQGITCPPATGAAYNVSKAGVKVFAEQLSYNLAEETNGRITAHLVVPGWVFTKLTRGDNMEKPEGAWDPQQIVDYSMPRIAKGDFYIICPDNETDEATDRARMEWSSTDVVENRPALSRWSKSHKAQFEAFMKEKTCK